VGIQLQNGPHKGRLVIPCDHTGPGYFGGSHALTSDDGGKSWQVSAPIAPACNECQVVELADGRLMMNMRTQDTPKGDWDKIRKRTGYRSISYSSDGGKTWTDPVFDKNLGDPMCQASLIRYSWPGDGERSRLLFSNPSPKIGPERGQRHRMTVRLSDDEGQTWPVSRLIHKGPAAYSCLARLADGQIGLLYEAGEKNAYETITLATFGLDWLTEEVR
jgi:sialidase-1